VADSEGLGAVMPAFPFTNPSAAGDKARGLRRDPARIPQA
jgi:hypothetical protein